MTSQIRRSPLVLASLSAVVSVAACASSDGPKLVDPCATAAGKAFVAAGTAEVGVGNDFTPITPGQTVDVVPGAQGLHMFVVNVRVRDLDVDAMNQPGGVDAEAFDASGAQISMEYGCRARTFLAHADGWLYASGPYQLPLDTEALSRIDGAAVTLKIEVHDAADHQAIDTRTVVAHLVP